MPFTAPGDLTQIYSRRSTVDFNRMPVMTQLSDDRSDEINAAYQVLISNPTYTAPADAVRQAAYDRSADDWPTGTEAEATFITMAVDQVVKDARDLKLLDAIELPLNYLERIRASMAAQLAVDYEANYVKYLGSLTYTGREADIGDSSNHMDKDNTVTGSIGDLIYDAFWDFNVYLVNANVMGPSAGPMIGGAAGMPYAVMNPELFREFAKWFLDQKYSWDALTADIISQNSLLASGAFRGMIGGIPIFTTPAIPKPTDNGAGHTWLIQMGTTMANATARRQPVTQFLTPEVNQDKYRYELKQILFFGRVEVNSLLNYRVRLATA